ncbi:hypothetical protein D3876_04705 [Sphingomonas cavernae]|uniref:DUF4175 domain-containing protein n=1 Tax=Sphingomonas cavernae TaxID=2320861 RepID=A0A418WQV6_9SPHN|nr:hypothetical protein D3876_04705 [Sphingomonas cavernae]
MKQRRENNLGRTYLWPAVLAAITIAALVAGLLGARTLDVAAWLGLAIPAALGIWKLVPALPRQSGAFRKDR